MGRNAPLITLFNVVSGVYHMQTDIHHEINKVKRQRHEDPGGLASRPPEAVTLAHQISGAIALRQKDSLVTCGALGIY